MLSNTSLTSGYDVYASLSDRAIQKIFDSLANVRPRYFRYTTRIGNSATENVTLVPPIQVPGTNQSIDYSLSIATPQISFYPDQFNVAPPVGMPINLDHFGLALAAEICIATGPVDTPNSVCAKLDIWAVGHIETLKIASDLWMSLIVDDIQLVGAGGLSPLLEHIFLILLNALLSKAQLPVQSLAQGGLPFALADGPKIDGEQAGVSPGRIKVWGTLQ